MLEGQVGAAEVPRPLRSWRRGWPQVGRSLFLEGQGNGWSNRGIWSGEGQLQRHFGSDQSAWRDGDWNSFVRIAVAGLLDVSKCRGGRGITSAVEILVVDDELAIRKGLAAMLEGAGYSVRTARDGIAALGAVRARRPDLVLLDVMMPLMDGFAVCVRIRQFDRDLPIVFLTAKDADEDQVRGLEVGADDFVSKSANESCDQVL